MKTFYKKNSALLIIDMQNYYLSKDSSYFQYFNHIHPGCLDYLIAQSWQKTIPNIIKLANAFRKAQLKIIYLKLCSQKQDRSDLHPFFLDTHKQGEKHGFPDIYPLYTDHAADIIEELSPHEDDPVILKKTFSPFTSTDIKELLITNNIETLVTTGLATSQCVETTARDASDHGFNIVQIADAQVDYDEITHNSSLFSSQGVCGGFIEKTDNFINSYFNNVGIKK